MSGPAALSSDQTVETDRPAATGVLPSQWLRRMVAAGDISVGPGCRPIQPSQIQPASLDLRLGDRAYRVNASFLPGKGAAVQDRLADLAIYSVPLADGAVLERDCVYIIPLQERIRLRSRVSALTNPKSSIGRLDIFARVITDGGVQFDRIEPSYDGPLYVEVVPRTFSVRVRTGSRLVQARIRHGSPPGGDPFHRRLQEQHRVIGAAGDQVEIRDGITFSVDVNGAGPDSVVGFKARRHSGLIDVDEVGRYEPLDFWEPVLSRKGRGLILDPKDFYILASKEPVSVPANTAAEMVAYDTLVGEFRVHYAGFFDPGFGTAEAAGAGSKGVLEVRSRETPFLLEDGQTVAKLVYEPLAERPSRLYGEGGSHYQRQGLKLSKHFRSW